MENRDLKIINAVLKEKDPETIERVSGYLGKLGKSEIEALIGIKQFISDNRVEIRALGKGQATKSYCKDIVCNIVACVANSSCDNGACSQNACSAAAGCYIGNLAGCASAPTCGNAACSSNSGGNCGNAICSYVVGKNPADIARRRK